MQYGTYLRIETAAGGLCASDRALIRAMRRKLKRKALRRECREKRRALIRDLFEYRDAALAQWAEVYKARLQTEEPSEENFFEYIVEVRIPQLLEAGEVGTAEEMSRLLRIARGEA